MKDTKHNVVGFIGAGTVGTALAIRLSQHGYRVASVHSQPPDTAELFSTTIAGCDIKDTPQSVVDSADITFITTPDDVIPNIATQITSAEGKRIVHCCGSDSVAILEPARRHGAYVGGFHPLQTFAGVQQAIDNLPGSTFALEAEEPLLDELKDMAEAIGGRWITLDSSDKPAYHAAAVFASNYLVTLIKCATDLWKTFDVPTDTAVNAMLPLIRGTLNNIENIGIPDCLTGPIARGDSGTINKHLAMLEKRAPSLLAAYRELGKQTVPIALAKGKVDTETAAQMEELLINN